MNAATDADTNPDILDARVPVTFTAAQLAAGAVRDAFRAGFTARAGSRCPAHLKGAARKAWVNGRAGAKYTRDETRAWSNFAAVEGFWAESAAACVAETIRDRGMLTF